MINNRTPTAPTQGADLGDRRDARSRAIYNHRQSRRCIGDGLVFAWKAGAALEEVKASLEHGAWTPWLREAGIPERTARHYRRLFRGVSQTGKLCRFRFRGLGAQGAPPEGEARRAEPPDPEDDRDREGAGRPVGCAPAGPGRRGSGAGRRAVGKGSAPEDRLRRSRPPGAGWIRPGRDVLTERQEAIRQLKARVSDLEQTNGTLLGENRGLRRLLKQRDKLIETLQGAVA